MTDEEAIMMPKFIGNDSLVARVNEVQGVMYRQSNELGRLNRAVKKYKDENAKLRKQIDDAHISRLLTENENESLRKLIADVHEALRADKAGMFHKLTLASMEDDMRELGVEVD
jgi:hypothetical protein